jgi:hypothetical protein
MKDPKYPKNGGVAIGQMVGLVVRAMKFGEPIELMLQGGHVVRGKLLGYGGVEKLPKEEASDQHIGIWDNAIIEVSESHDYGAGAKWVEVNYVHASQVVAIKGRCE